MAEIFLSYAHDDQERVQPLVRALKAQGFTLWWDRGIEEGIKGGDEWLNSIEEALTAAKAVIVVWTQNSKKSRFVKEEANEAIAQEKCVPLVLDAGAVPFGFRTIQAENFIDWAGDLATDAWQRLVLQLKALVTQEDGGGEPAQQMGGWAPVGALALLAPAGLGGPLNLDIGPYAGVLAFAGFFFLLFWAADERLSPHLKAISARWLLPERDGVRVSVAEAFNNLFEAVFGRRHLSVRCVSSSFLASMLALAVITGLAWLLIPDFKRSLGSFGQFALITILLTVATNLLGDYVSLWQTRIFLRWAKRWPWSLPFIIVADYFLTALLFTFVFLGSFFALQLLFSDFLTFAFTEEGYRELTLFDLFFTLVPEPTDSLSLPAEQWFVVFSIATTYVTSIWLWLVAIGGPVVKLFLGRDGRVSLVGRALGAEDRPFTALGIITSLAILLMGLTLTAFSSLEDEAQKPSGPEIFKDCSSCPEMVVVPAGSFTMGSPEGEAGRYRNEGPLRLVTIARPFAVGRFEVTFSEWDHCVADKGCEHRPQDQRWGRGTRPVIDVSWDDAQAYVAWLSLKTGKPYRLLSEAEWEYAARANADPPTPYWFGTSITTGQANFQGARTRVVGSYPANGFGLHDTHGNVWEWVQDCYEPSYANNPGDGSAVEPDDPSACSTRVLRGGSWYFNPQNLRSAFRFRGRPVGRDYNVGFRVARDLD